MGAIQGIGVDVVDVKRMKIALDAWGPALVKKMFTDTEIAYCKSKKKAHEHFAAVCGEGSCEQGDGDRLGREVPVARCRDHQSTIGSTEGHSPRFRCRATETVPGARVPFPH